MTHYRDKAFAFIRQLDYRKQFTGEDIRWLLVARIGYSCSAHEWGPIIRDAKRLGLLVDTGARRAMRSLTSHERRTPIYRPTTRAERAWLRHAGQRAML